MEATLDIVKDKTPGLKRATKLGLRVVALVYLGLTVYLFTQTYHPPHVEKYPSALSWINATNSFALLGSVLGIAVTLPTGRRIMAASLSVVAFTVSFILSCISLICVILSYFSVYWIVFSSIHIFLSMVAVGAAFTQYSHLKFDASHDETQPLAPALKPTENV